MVEQAFPAVAFGGMLRVSQVTLLPSAADVSTTRIVLQPFENLAGDPAQDVLARGLSYDLAAELARFATLEVVPPNSASHVLATGDRDEASARLFVLNGGLRRIDGRIRLSVQLTERTSGRQVWADRIDAGAEEILHVQDDIVAQVAAALALRADEARLTKARRKPMVSLEAYECWLRGRDCLQQGTLESDAEARVFFERALELDPHFARAYAGLSLSHFNEWSCQAWVQWDDKERHAFAYAKRAADLDSSDAMVEIVLGRIMLYRRRFDEAAEHVARALALNPNDADVLAHAALCRALLGDGASGLELATKATRLNPTSGDWYIGPAALSLFVLGRLEESIAFAVRMPNATLDCPALLAAALALAGDYPRATVYLQRFLADFDERVTFGRAPDPGEPLRWLLHVNPFRRAEDVERITTGLRLAGLPIDPDTERPAAAGTAPAGKALSGGRATDARFFQQGDRWQLAFEGTVISVADAKGLRDVASLLACRGEERHCLELAGRPAETSGQAAMLDDRARREYRARLIELQREIDEAERDHDQARGGRAREEMDSLVEALSGALGLGGRSRSLGSAAERARSAVTWRIRSAIRKIAALHPALGRHLENSIRTGTYCSYQPERPIDWQLLPL
jgi:TolB-like protein